MRRNVENPELSIVVPLYNEEKRLPGCMARLISYVEINLIQAEIILVPNGCTDGTLELAHRYHEAVRPWVRVLHIPTRGKGAAVRTGVLSARGELIYMADVDLSAPIREFRKFLEFSEHGFDVVIGSREKDGARVTTSAKRRLVGRVFNLFTRALAPGIQDTQCGFKLFKARAARDIFERVTINGWAFDVEVLYLARRLGYTVAEIPIEWENDPDTRVNLVPDSMAMLADVIKIPLSHARPLSPKVPA